MSMHKYYYASGFLYNSITEKILLQLTSTNGDPSYSFFSVKCMSTEDPLVAFQKNFAKTLSIIIPIASVIPVYEYISSTTNENYSILYADVSTIVDIDKKIENKAEWFTYKQITKLPIPKQVSHDIMIGQRVIRANTPLY